MPGNSFAFGHLEGDAVGDTFALSRFAGRLDRLVVIVEAEELGLGKGLGHQHGGGALAAANVGHARAGFELLLNAVKRGNPRAHEIGGVAGTEELLAAVKDAVVVLVPAHAGAGAEGFGNARNRSQRSQREFERARQIGGTVFVGQSEGLLFAQAEFVLFSRCK